MCVGVFIIKVACFLIIIIHVLMNVETFLADFRHFLD